MLETNDGSATATDVSEAKAAVTSRRKFLSLGAAAAGYAAAQTVAAPVAEAQGSIRPGPRSPQPLAGLPQDASQAWTNPVLRLLRRVTTGFTPGDLAQAKQMGYAAYLNYQLKPAAIDDSAVDAFIATNMPMVGMTYANLILQDSNEVNAQLQDAALYRAAFSKRQLLERMVDFWTDHFTIALSKVGIRKTIDDRDVIRPNALGKFPDLLRATSKSPAMLVYLDQNLSKFPTPNQNYAREIMELHTLGVNGGYTQTDVAELSRILTGWSVTGADFVFTRGNHDRGQNGPKVFLGRTFPTMPTTATTADMQKEGEDAINMLVAHPSTAAYISLKMARWLLAYTPPQSVVDATAAVYLATGGDIAEMIKTILTPTNLMASVAKYRRPFHMAAASLRALGATTLNIRTIRQSSDAMGMPMFMWEQPNGYPDRIDWWSGLVLSRWQFATTLSNINSATTTKVDVAPFKVNGTAAEAIVGLINDRVYGGEMALSLKTALIGYVNAATYSDTRLRETLSLAISAHQFQWY